MILSQAVFIILFFIIVIAAALVLFNNVAVIKRFKIKNDKIKKPIRILLMSDLHNKLYNTHNTYILKKVQKLKPDFIVFAGDLIDKRRPKPQIGFDFLNGLAKIAPTYYITGNHERTLGITQEIKDKIECVSVIDNSEMIFENYALLGLEALYEDEDHAAAAEMLKTFENLDTFKIVITHMPYYYYGDLKIKDSKIDLMLCGHTHGGVARIPFYGAFYAPGEGFFPKYSRGMYKEKDTVMIVSGGLGNTFLPLRMFNFPQIISIDVENETEL